MRQERSQRLIVELLRSIDSVGIEGTISALRNVQESVIDKSEILQTYIIECCKDYFGWNNSRNKLSSFDKTQCTATICFLISKNLNYSQTKIGQIVRKDNSVVSKYIKRINHLNVHHKTDKYWQEKINTLDGKIKSFKEQIINNDNT